MDGSDPTISSSLFAIPFSIQKTTQVKAALFVKGSQAGKESEKTFYFYKAGGKVWMFSDVIFIEQNLEKQK